MENGAIMKYKQRIVSKAIMLNMAKTKVIWFL